MAGECCEIFTVTITDLIKRFDGLTCDPPDGPTGIAEAERGEAIADDLIYGHLWSNQRWTMYLTR